jgi:hypothetical protein
MIKLKREGRSAKRKNFVSFLTYALVLILLVGNGFQLSAKPSFNNISWFLSPSDPFVQNWSNTGLITTNNDWSNVHAINGYSGDGLTAVPGVNPQTILADGAGTPLFVIANQSNPNTLLTGGVAEFDGIANPTVALQGSDTASAPHLAIRLNFTDCPAFKRITVGYKIRDVESSADNAVQQVALQYRRGITGNYTNVPEAFVADATDANAATKVSTIVATLPHFTVLPSPDDNILYLRIITANAVGADEWVGIDDINIGCFAPLNSSSSVSGRVVAPNGQPVAGATVTMTDEYGQKYFARTSPFGYYRFGNIDVGGIMVLNVASKKYNFEPRVISVTETLENIDFEGQ